MRFMLTCALRRPMCTCAASSFLTSSSDGFSMFSNLLFCSSVRRPRLRYTERYITIGFGFSSFFFFFILRGFGTLPHTLGARPRGPAPYGMIECSCYHSDAYLGMAGGGGGDAAMVTVDEFE